MSAATAARRVETASFRCLGRIVAAALLIAPHVVEAEVAPKVPRIGSFVTGAAITADGGLTAHPGLPPWSTWKD